MAIMLDGQYTTQQVKNKVTYKAPAKVTYTQPKNTANDAYQRYVEEQKRKQQQQRAQNAYAQRMQAQADAYRNQQQAMQQQQRYPVTNNLVPQAANQGVGLQIGPYNPPKFQGYGSWGTDASKNLAPGATMNMTNQQKVQNSALMPMLQSQIPGPYGAQPDRWATTPQAKLQQNKFSTYQMQQNRLLQLLQNDYKNMIRQRSDGYYYLLPGLGYPPQPPKTSAITAPAPDYGGGYDDWGNWGGGGGGGGGGSTYTPKPPEWWVEMVNWRI